MSNQPLLIALCGAPGSGKTTLQHLLSEHFNIAPADDGEVIRHHIMEIADLTWEDVTTQAGKRRYVTLFGRRWQVRELLGEYGNLLEGMFGEQAIPELAVRRATCKKDKGASLFTSDTQSPIGYSFGSVRRRQGLTYQKAGGVVVELVRAGEARVGAGYEFDGYDRSLVDFTIHNSGTSLEDLYRELLGSELGRWIRDRSPNIRGTRL